MSGAFGRLVTDKAVKCRDPGLNRSREILPKSVADGIFGRFRDNCRPEIAGDVISCSAADYVGFDDRVKFGDRRLNSGRIILSFPAGPVLRTCIQYSTAFCSRPEAAANNTDLCG